jgi:hypothetical protein
MFYNNVYGYGQDWGQTRAGFGANVNYRIPPPKKIITTLSAKHGVTCMLFNLNT